MHHSLQPVLEPGSVSSLPPPTPLPACVLAEEERFYGAYSWCLNPCLTVGAATARLADEINRLERAVRDWERNEHKTNVYLLGCALLNWADDYLHGPMYHVPRPVSSIPLTGLALKVLESGLRAKRAGSVRRVASWRQNLDAALHVFTQSYLSSLLGSVGAAGGDYAHLVKAVGDALPASLQGQYTQIPSCFRKLDLTTHDVLALGNSFIAEWPARNEKVLLVGLRTAGSYFAPLIRALLVSQGYQSVAALTIRPDKGLSGGEKLALESYASEGYRALLLDDPPVTGETFVHAADVLRKRGFAADRVAVLFPAHASPRDSRATHISDTLGHLKTLVLEPDNWHKKRLLEEVAVENQLNDYFANRGYASASIVRDSDLAHDFNRRLESFSEEERRTRLKHVFEVRLQTMDGKTETRYILAKSVGWGYLSYHAFLAAARLQGFVPPLLGMRDGMLFMEWLPSVDDHPGARDLIHPATMSGETREQRSRPDLWIEGMACYVAERAKNLPMPDAAALQQGLHRYDHAFEMLAKVLSKAYGHPIVSRLMRSRVRRLLTASLCPRPTFIDGKMRESEWVVMGSSILKTDFEHHGTGKNELNVVDPYLDLADASLQFELSPEEEDHLVARYCGASGDELSVPRFFLHKLLAGTWTMHSAMRNLERESLARRQQEYHREFVRAWDYLTVASARHCGRLCGRPAKTAAGPALVILDVDGVIDRRVFGYPCTSEAGIQALALLNAHGLPFALNTARAVAEVEAYCDAYGGVGGVAEYGSYVWDAVKKRGRVLISEAALEQMQRARHALARVPGVFLNDGYQYSIKACTYENGAPTPLPTPLIQRFLADHDFDQLSLHQTSIDSTIVSKAVNKGTGLTSLVDWLGMPGVQTWAVGDSDPDLAMFRVASRSFAPAHIGCGRMARCLGAEIAPQPFQRGLLHIVRQMIHPDGTRCDRCAASEALWRLHHDPFLEMLRMLDRKRLRLFFGALLHPAVLEVFAD